MKKVLLASLLSFGIASIAQADIGVVKDGFGKIMQTEQFTVVKKALKKGEQLKRHNHEGDSVIFTVLSGKMNVVKFTEKVIFGDKVITCLSSSFSSNDKKVRS